MSKKDYRVRNWKDYNKSLINRGRVTFWLDEKSINNWYENNNLPNQQIEALLRCHALNKMTLLGMPASMPTSAN